MFANELFVGGDVDAVNLIAGDVAVDPLNLGAELTQDSAGCLGDRFEFITGQVSGTGNLALDNVLGHGTSVRKYYGRASVPGWTAGVESVVEVKSAAAKV